MAHAVDEFRHRGGADRRWRVLALRQYLRPRRAGLTLPGSAVKSRHEAAEWRSLGTFMRDANQGYGIEHVFLATGAVRVPEQASGDLEESEVVELAPDRLRAALADGSVPIVSHAAGMALALLALG